ncbi:N-methyltransferase [Marichromatium purpuratum 984]|uniref:Prepilin leader peptidase/N-methyltransferase n=1 Tax=Marichromatium purpuratum 984 TaxID=765910 RepID=W0E799_MARPU|nr:A24 family peptidase [Marichromatium purpuratum]AHF04941.1 N-methyltransferase [Marichromatium purpuratum 984]
MPWLEPFQQSPMLLYVTVTLLGLILGSFLNVVILRLPRMLEHEWRAQCAEFAGESADATPPPGLARPPSTCPHCGHRIRAHENIPLLSFLLLRGRCSACKTPIGWRYPAVELLTALLGLVAALHFGASVQLLAALVLTWGLVALAVIDLDTQLLPDRITLPLLWLGLILSLFGVFTDAQAAIIGAAAGYLLLWSLYHAFRLLTGKEGMGYGDFKLLALFGAWLGWQALPLVILLSAVSGALIGGVLIALRRQGRDTAMPFGPFLAVAGWVALLWGEQITGAYLRLSGLG